MIAIVLAAFDEADSIGGVLSRLPVKLSGHPVVTVVADDGSQDGTAQVAAGYDACVVRLPRNRGKATAIAAGRRLATELGATIVVEMDADGQHDPACLSDLAGPVVRGEADLVIGSRYLHDATRGPTPRNRYIVRTLFSRLLDRLLRQPASDPFSGYRCYRLSVLQQMHLTARGYDGELELRIEAARCRAEVAEVAVPRIYGPATTKMHRRGGPALGRVRVLGQYGAAMASGGGRLAVHRLRARVNGHPVTAGAAAALRAVGGG